MIIIKYWINNKIIMKNFSGEEKYIKKFVFFGIGSAILLIMHSIFLGIKFDISIYKFFRRFVMVSFIIFELVAQVYLVVTLYKIKNKITEFISLKVLKIKLILVSLLVLTALISIPIVSMPGNKFFKHALEWNFFVGVISFYLLTFFMWKIKKKS